MGRRIGPTVDRVLEAPLCFTTFDFNVEKIIRIVSMDDAAELSSAGTKQIEELIVRFIRDELVDDADLELDAEDNLLASGLIDSVGFVRLIAHLRAQLSIVVPPQDMVPENFQTIQVMTSYFERLLRR